MNNQDTSRLIRKYALSQCDLIDNVYGNIHEDDKVKIFFASLDNIESNDKCHLLNGSNIPTVINLNALKGTAILTRIQMYTDHYRISKLQDKLYNTHSLSTFPKVDTYGSIKKFTRDENVQYEILESLREYYESSGLDKVLFNKCLNKKDVKHLKAINPFFEEEYEKSNVDVDLDFIVKHIEKWQKHCPYDLEISYDSASRFVFDLYNIKKNEAEKLLIELFNQDLGIISSTKENEDYIKIGPVTLNIDNLSLMFKDYYKYQEKVLKKRR